MGTLRADRITGLGGADAIKGSVFFGGGGGLVSPESDDFKFCAGGDFTIEAWVNTFEFGNAAAIVACWDQTGADGSGEGGDCWLFNINTSGVLQLAWSPHATDVYFITGGTLTKDTWHHVAVTRNGNTFRIFLDGTQTATGTNSSTNNTNSELFIGRYGGYGLDYYWHGNISNVRILKGEALYTSTFTPPNRELTVTPNTVLVACQSPGNISQEATGKHLSIIKKNVNDAPPVASSFTPNSPVGFSTTTDVGSQYGSTFDGFGSFATSTYMVPPGGNTRERNRGRAVFGGGESPTADNVMEYLNIQSGGRTIDFGDHSAGGTPSGDAVASSTRGVFTVHASPNTNALEFITIANTGNSQDFGDQTTGGVSQEAAASNSTRGLFAGGIFPGSTVHDTTEYITIATLGNAIDFGNLIASVTSNTGVADATRALFAGGIGPSSPFPTVNRIEYFTIANTGNATDFGDLTFSARYPGSAGDSTRGVFMGGATPSAINTICFVTIQTTGDATDYGDLVTASHDIAATSNNTRAIMGGGGTPSRTNTIEQLTIQTNGNATDFGDLSRKVDQLGVCSDSHGGIS